LKSEDTLFLEKCWWWSKPTSISLPCCLILAVHLGLRRFQAFQPGVEGGWCLLPPTARWRETWQSALFRLLQPLAMQVRCSLQTPKAGPWTCTRYPGTRTTLQDGGARNSSRFQKMWKSRWQQEDTPPASMMGRCLLTSRSLADYFRLLFLGSGRPFLLLKASAAELLLVRGGAPWPPPQTILLAHFECEAAGPLPSVQIGGRGRSWRVRARYRWQPTTLRGIRRQCETCGRN